MKLPRHTFFRLALAAATFAASTILMGNVASSQIMPRTIKLVVPYPPGATWFTSALAAPAIKSKLIEQESYAVSVCGPEFGAYIRRQYEEVGRTVREASIKAE